MSKKIKILISALTLLIMLPSLVIPSSANSAPTEWEGKDANGVMTTDGDCPIVVEHENLSFNIQELILDYYDVEAIDWDKSNVTAEYTFYNPSDMTVTAKLSFPFGTTDGYNYDTYKILANGEEVETVIRHTLSDSYGQYDFDIEKDLPLLLDDYARDEFFNEDMTVTAYNIMFDCTNASSKNRVYYGFDLDAEKYPNTKFYLSDFYYTKKQDDGDLRVYSTANGYINLYAFGDVPESLPTIKFYDGNQCVVGNEVNGCTSNIKSTETIKFSDFIFSNYDEERGISQLDWYNATVHLMQKNSSNSRLMSLDSFKRGFERSLMTWYQYELTFEPGEKIINSVTAPMIPGANIDYDPDIYIYTYLLSPASTWKSFGSLDIYINTPYYITDCSLDGFTKNETGYELHLNGLPREDKSSIFSNENKSEYKELEFTLSTDENPERESNDTSIIWIIVVILIIPFLIIYAIIQGIKSLFK